MRLVTIGLVSTNPTVGALETNTRNAINFALIAAESGCHLVCLPEMCLSGYPAEDLVQWGGYVDQLWTRLEEFAAETAHERAVFALGLAVRHNGALYNCIAFVHQGKILGGVPKEELPTYGVFYDLRTFSLGIPGYQSTANGVPFGDLLFRFPWGTVGGMVCEDLWGARGPASRRAFHGAEILVDISASPFRVGVLESRRRLVSTRAAECEAVVAYTNQSGGQDALVFDGGGFVSVAGTMVLEAPRWQFDQRRVTMATVDLDQIARARTQDTTWRMEQSTVLQGNGPRPLLIEAGSDCSFPEPKRVSTPVLLPVVNECDDLLEAMVAGLAGYFEKTGAFKRIGIALSGGKDSALVLLVAYLYAFGVYRRRTEIRQTTSFDQFLRDFICCFSMPTHHNSKDTKDSARQLADALGVSFKEISIQEAYEREAEAARQMVGGELTSVTLENIQARIRAGRMWNWANSAQGLFIQTGNMSERSVGWTTVGGDLMGSFSLISNLPKTKVFVLLRYLQHSTAFKFSQPVASAIEVILSVPSSPELKDGQTTEGSLMPFPVMDKCFDLFAGSKMMPDDMCNVLSSCWTVAELKAMDPTYHDGKIREWVALFCRRFMQNVFKWEQTPQGVHLMPLDLDRKRALQIPVATSQEWLRLEELDT